LTLNPQENAAFSNFIIGFDECESLVFLCDSISKTELNLCITAKKFWQFVRAKYVRKLTLKKTKYIIESIDTEVSKVSYLPRLHSATNMIRIAISPKFWKNEDPKELTILSLSTNLICSFLS
jgi:tRNA A37 threonylcarbamoyladenosine dehydratase